MFIILLAAMGLLRQNSSFGYTFSITEDMKKLPPEQLQKIIDEQNDKAYEEQTQVAKRRYEQRMETKTAISNFMNEEAEKRQQMILENKRLLEKSDEKVEMANNIFIISSLMVVIVLGGYVFYRRMNREQ